MRKMKMKRTASMVLAAAMVFSAAAFPAAAKTSGTVCAAEINAYVLAKDGSTENLLTSWTLDTENDTYVDGQGNEIPGVVTPDSYLLYTGSDNGNFARAGVVTKYIPIDSFAEDLSEMAGVTYNADTVNLYMESTTDNWKNTYGKDGSDFLVSNQNTLYSSLDWLEACRANGCSSNGVTFSTEDYTDSKAVPTVLAITSYNERLYNFNETKHPGLGLSADSNEDMLSSIDTLAANTDAANALRLFSGMDPANDSTKYMGTGKNSIKGISKFVLQPEYNAINVAAAQAEGTEGQEGYILKSGRAYVTASDNWFKAAEGESVALTSNAPVTITDSENNEISVTQSGSVYSFVMPASAVTVTLGEPADENISVTVDDRTAGKAVLTAPAEGWTEGENVFTVSCSSACSVLLKDQNGALSVLLAAASGSSSVYSFTADLADGDSVIVAMKGDANQDGILRIQDTRLINSQSMSGDVFDAVQKYQCDIDGNGVVDTKDSRQVMLTFLGSRQLNW